MALAVVGCLLWQLESDVAVGPHMKRTCFASSMKRRDVVEKDFPGKRHFEANHVRAMRFPVEKLLRYYRELDTSEPCCPCRATFVCFLFSSI